MTRTPSEDSDGGPQRELCAVAMPDELWERVADALHKAGPLASDLALEDVCRDALDAASTDRAHSHLADCEPCRQRLSRERDLVSWLAPSRVAALEGEDVLAAARLQLRAQGTAVAPPATASDALAELRAGPSSRYLRFAVAAALVLALGLPMLLSERLAGESSVGRGPAAGLPAAAPNPSARSEGVPEDAAVVAPRAAVRATPDEGVRILPSLAPLYEALRAVEANAVRERREGEWLLALGLPADGGASSLRMTLRTQLRRAARLAPGRGDALRVLRAASLLGDESAGARLEALARRSVEAEEVGHALRSLALLGGRRSGDRLHELFRSRRSSVSDERWLEVLQAAGDPVLAAPLVDVLERLGRPAEERFEVLANLKGRIATRAALKAALEVREDERVIARLRGEPRRWRPELQKLLMKHRSWPKDRATLLAWLARIGERSAARELARSLVDGSPEADLLPWVLWWIARAPEDPEAQRALTRLARRVGSVRPGYVQRAVPSAIATVLVQSPEHWEPAFRYALDRVALSDARRMVALAAVARPELALRLLGVAGEERRLRPLVLEVALSWRHRETRSALWAFDLALDHGAAAWDARIEAFLDDLPEGVSAQLCLAFRSDSRARALLEAWADRNPAALWPLARFELPSNAWEAATILAETLLRVERRFSIARTVRMGFRQTPPSSPTRR